MKKFLSALCLLAGSTVGCDCAGDALEASFDEALQEAAEQARREAEQARAAGGGADPGAVPTPASATTFTCDQVSANGLCYTTAPMQALLPGEQTGCEASGGTWTEGEACPSEGVLATCSKDQNQERRRYYRRRDLRGAEAACTAFGGTFAPAS